MLLSQPCEKFFTMQEQILFSPIPLEELISRLKSELNISQPSQQQETTEEEFLTAKEVSKLLGVSLVSLHKWKKDGKIKFHRYGSRIRFRKSEIINSEKYGRAAK